jgi:hypothetical protein
VKLRRLPGFIQRIVVRKYMVEVAMPEAAETTKEAVTYYWQLHISE